MNKGGYKLSSQTKLLISNALRKQWALGIRKGGWKVSSEALEQSVWFKARSAMLIDEFKKELKNKIEGMKKGDINPDTGMPYYSPYWKGIRDGFNSALSEVIKMIQAKQ